MQIDFIPRARLVDALQSGWRLIPGHTYASGDYAILMMLAPSLPAPAISELQAQFERPRRVRMRTKCAGAVSAFNTRQRRAMA